MNRLLSIILIAITCLLVGANPRSSKWPALRLQHLEIEPACVACGQSRRIEVHHVVPVSVAPERELDSTNLITLCRRDHLTFGHFGNFQRWNPHTREHAEQYRRWKTEHEKTISGERP
jgi:hypothetical protein